MEEARGFVDEVSSLHFWPIKGIETLNLFHIEGRVLTRIAPVITALLASLVAVCFLRRCADQSLFAFFFMFTGIHVLLLLAACVMFW